VITTRNEKKLLLNSDAFGRTGRLGKAKLLYMNGGTFATAAPGCILSGFFSGMPPLAL
jgi:hypothetical protein